MLDSSRVRGCLRLAVMVGLAGLVLLAACSGGRQDESSLLPPGLPPELAQHLTSGNDSSLAEYGRRAGFAVLADAKRKLNTRMRLAYIDGRTESAGLLFEYNLRLAGVIADEFDYPEYLWRMQFFEDLTLETRWRVMTREQEFYDYRNVVEPSLQKKLERFDEFLEFFQKHNDLIFVGMTEYEMAYAYRALNDTTRRIEYLRRSLRSYIDGGLHQMIAPTYTELGEYYDLTGHTDSMVIFFEAAKKDARDHRLPMEAADVCAQYAEHYIRRGHLSLAHDQYMEALEICRQYKGEYNELGYLVDAMAFQAGLGAWGIVGRLMDRAQILKSKYAGQTEEYLRLYLVKVDRMDAQLTLARGRVEAANEKYRRALEAIHAHEVTHHHEPQKIELYLGWSQGLLDQNRPDDAAGVLRQALDYSREIHREDFTAECYLLMANAEFRRNEDQAAWRALAGFDSVAAGRETALVSEYIHREALAGRLYLRRGDPESARQSLTAGLERLENALPARDAGVQSYLWINAHQDLRSLMFELTSDDPVAGYGAAMYWQRLFHRLGRPRETGRVSLDVLQQLGQQYAELFNARTVIHSAYAIDNGNIWRWTVSPGGVSRDKLTGTADRAHKLISQIWPALAPTPAGTTIPSQQAQAEILFQLAGLLLPAEISEAQESESKTSLLVTAEGVLSRIPFEIFNIGTETSYKPLMAMRDVGYFRPGRGAVPLPAGQPGIVLVNTEPSLQLQRRYPFLQQLDHAFPEGMVVSRAYPEARFLAGPEGTKANLLAGWETAPFIHLASHMVRDSQIPYLMLVPLAAPDRISIPEAGYLDFLDIRTADLRASQFVLLSGCASGAPYVGAHTAGPSLGDAFIDAGSGAVVQTFWDISDQDAKKFVVRHTMNDWGRDGLGKVRALSSTRRHLAGDRPAAADYYKWAAYSIKIGRL